VDYYVDNFEFREFYGGKVLDYRSAGHDIIIGFTDETQEFPSFAYL
jgi:hypothetical protein